MATFPSYGPQTRSFTPGVFAAVAVSTYFGGETSVRRTNASNGHTLSMTFVSNDTTLQRKIYEHYVITNRFLPFDLPDIVLEGSGLGFPADYQWIYAKPPEAEYTPELVTVSVSLELVPPYLI
jgi:hypothetical protein|tara:strand:+ start:647 stop:1015 length:369 start_codon:yes stop_codon:yes gene_type:complete